MVLDDEGIYNYQMDYQQKIGEKGAWESIGGPLTEEMVEGFYKIAPGKYEYTITWGVRTIAIPSFHIE